MRRQTMEKLHKKRKTKRKAGQKRRRQEKDVARTRGPWAGEGVENGASRRSPLSSLSCFCVLIDENCSTMTREKGRCHSYELCPFSSNETTFPTSPTTPLLITKLTARLSFTKCHKTRVAATTECCNNDSS